jgi:prophage antirepressor-like protein
MNERNLMMKDLTTFTFKTAPVRVVTIDGEPWFVAVDVCRALGLATDGAGVARHLTAVGRDEEQYLSRSNVNLNDVSFPNRGARCVSESGLYKLIMRSDKPQARAFQDWVTREVLPAIRKDGAYVMGEEKVATGEMSEEEFVLKAIDILQRKVERLKQEVKDKEKTIGGLKTTIGKHDHTLARFIRTLPGVNAMKIKSDLLDLGYLYRRGGAYRVYRQFDALFTEKFDDRYGHVEIMVTKEGKQKIAELYMAGLLTMKKGFLPSIAEGEHIIAENAD